LGRHHYHAAPLDSERRGFQKLAPWAKDFVRDLPMADNDKMALTIAVVSA
jgi:hypothetical protein